MASIKPLSQADRRPLLGANRSREPITFAAESDPSRHLTSTICCAAQLLNSLFTVAWRQHLGSRGGRILSGSFEGYP
jgi:hypothetical protein